MLFTIDKESLLNKVRIVEKITIQRGIQPVLANILFEAADGELKLSATDLDLYVVVKTMVSVKEEGKITLPAKKLLEIASRLPDKPVEFELNKENNVVKITCGSSKFEIVGISASEFPVAEDSQETEKEELTIDTAPLLKSIKNTVYAAAGYENRNIISGVFCKIKADTIEMAATDGNRLTRMIETVKNNSEKEAKIVIPSKTLQEFARISQFVADDKVQLIVSKSKLLIKSKSFMIKSRLLEGEYPPYEQLIPKTTTYEVSIPREELINSLERVSCMVNERSVVKFDFSKNKLILKAETPNAGASEDIINCDFDGEPLVIAFNYKYVLDVVKTMESENTKIGISGSATATVFKPESEERYICLIMPIQLR